MVVLTRQQVIRVAVYTLALLATITWPDFLGHGFAFFSANDIIERASGLNGRFFFLCGMAIAASVMVVSPFFAEGRSLPWTVAQGVLGVVSACAFFLAEKGIIVVVAAVVTGFAFITLLSQIFLSASQHLSEDEIIVTCSLTMAFKLVLCTVLEAPQNVVVEHVSVVMLPLVGAVSLLAVRKLAPNMIDKQAEEMGPGNLSFALVMGLLVISALLFGSTRYASDMGYWGSAYPLPTASVLSSLLGVVLFLAVCWVTFSLAPRNPVFRFMPPLVLLLAFYTASAFGAFGGLVPDGSTQTTLTGYAEIYGHLLDWLIIFFAILELTVPAIRVFGVQTLIFTVVEMALQLFEGFTGLTVTYLPIVVLYCGFVVLIVFLYRVYGKGIVSPQTRVSLQTQSRHATEKQDIDDQGVKDLIASKYGLSAREKDVFMLLAQGRSRNYICDELCIANGTASTHITRIYEKLGVHNKQDLLSLVIAQSEEIRSQDAARELDS